MSLSQRRYVSESVWLRMEKISDKCCDYEQSEQPGSELYSQFILLNQVALGFRKAVFQKETLKKMVKVSTGEQSFHT